MPMQSLADEHITLTAVAKIAPGRPSPNAVWRWCRRGVQARNGQRVRLEHIRVGGKIFTTRGWLDEFGRKLADADRRYFDLNEAIAESSAPAPPRPDRRKRSRVDEDRRRAIADAERELDEAGI